MIVPSCASSESVPDPPAPSFRSSASALSERHEPAEDLSAVEPDLHPHESRSATRNHLRENAVDGIGMDERDLEAEQPTSRNGVDQLRTRRLELLERASRESSVPSATWCIPGPRRARKRPTGVSSPVGLTSSKRLSPTSSDAASTPCSTSGSRCSSLRVEEALVRRDGLVEIDDRDAEVMDAARPHSRDAIRAASCG